jgi:hypothetical protein
LIDGLLHLVLGGVATAGHDLEAGLVHRIVHRRVWTALEVDSGRRQRCNTFAV